MPALDVAARNELAERLGKIFAEENRFNNNLLEGLTIKHKPTGIVPVKPTGIVPVKPTEMRLPAPAE